MRPDLRCALLATALLAVTPARAVPVLPGAIAPASPADAQAVITRALALGKAGDCPGALVLLDPLVAGLGAGQERNVAQTVRLSCLGAVGRTAEMPAVQRELAVALPKSAFVKSMGVLVAASTGAYEEAAEKLSIIAGDADDETLALIPADSWRAISQKLTQDSKVALRDRVVVALARADWTPAELPEMRDTLALGAIGALLADGQTSEAGLLLPRITMPELLTEMATERAYQPLWPAIEARMGPAQGISADRFAATQLDAFARQPDDAHALRDAVRAFALLGRYAEASEVAASVKVADGMDEDAVATVRYDAQVLQAAGKPDAALGRLRAFTAVDPAKTPVAVSGLVALAEMLDETGHAQEALDVSRTALTRGASALSPWGQGWLVRTELCALATLGRAAEAKTVGDRLKAEATGNPAAAVEGLLCAGRVPEAAGIAIATLGTTEGASNIADQFQPNGAIWISSGSRLRTLWTQLLARPDVRAAFEKRARVLPRGYWPVRTPRPIPRSPGSGSDDAAALT